MKHPRGCGLPAWVTTHHWKLRGECLRRGTVCEMSSLPKWVVSCPLELIFKVTTNVTTIDALN
jgi:hypothetical protein